VQFILISDGRIRLLEIEIRDDEPDKKYLEEVHVTPNYNINSAVAMGRNFIYCECQEFLATLQNTNLDGSVR